MTPSTTEILLHADAGDHRVARLAALAIALAVAEAVIPSPIPGIKPGLANIVVLVCWVRYGWATAAWVSLLRVLAVSLLIGSFLAPAFFLSLAGALASLAALAAASILPRRWFGPVSASLLAAYAHIGGQLALAIGWFMPGAGIGGLLPFFAGAALAFGLANGLAAAWLLSRTP